MGTPANAYEKLLSATIQHLQRLRSRGVRFVPVSSETLRALNSAPARTTPARPAPQPPAPARTPVPSPPRAVTPIPASAPAPKPEPAPARAPQPAVRPPTQDKRAAFEALRARALACTRCSHLAAARRNVVFGVGSIDAGLMFVGEAPGADEDRLGEPFVGAAGQLLTKIIQTMGLSRDTVYIANILKCRPDTPGQTFGNRKPTPEEMQTCLPFLQEQIDLVQPKVLVALGATAVEGLLGATAGIKRLRGHWQTYRGIPLMPTYHPAYLLHNREGINDKRLVWEDMLEVMEKLGLPISEKQRGYFQRGA